MKLPSTTKIFKFTFQFTFCLLTSRDNFSFAFSPSCLDYFKLSRKSLFARWKCFHLKWKKFWQRELSQIEKIKKQQKKVSSAPSDWKIGKNLESICKAPQRLQSASRSLIIISNLIQKNVSMRTFLDWIHAECHEMNFIKNSREKYFRSTKLSS